MVQIAAADARVREVGREVLSHFLRERGHERALVFGDAGVDLTDEVVDLPLDGPHEDLRVEQAGRADDLLGDLARMLALVVARRGRDVDGLIHPLLELLKLQWAVVIRTRQAEAVLDKRVLARAVAAVHGAHLRQRDVALVDKEQKVLRKIVQQRHRRAAGGAAADDARIVLDAGAVAELLHHLNVIVRALADALRLEELTLLLERFHARVALGADLADGALHLFVRCDIVRRGIDRHVAERADGRAGDDVDVRDAVDLVAEKLHAHGMIRGVGRKNVDRVAADAEHIARKGNVVALVADVDELAHKLLRVALLAGAQGDDHVGVVDRVAEAIDARHGRDDDHVPPLEQARRGRVAQALDLIIDGGVLLDERVRVRDVRLRLVVVIVRHKIFHGVVREKLLELAAQLCREDLVVCEHERRPLDALDDLGHRVRLAGAGHAEQHLLVDAVFQPLHERVDRLGLVARRLIGRNDFKIRHETASPRKNSNQNIIPPYPPFHKRKAPGSGCFRAHTVSICNYSPKSSTRRMRMSVRRLRMAAETLSISSDRAGSMPICSGL